MLSIKIAVHSSIQVCCCNICHLAWNFWGIFAHQFECLSGVKRWKVIRFHKPKKPFYKNTLQTKFNWKLHVKHYFIIEIEFVFSVRTKFNRARFWLDSRCFAALSAKPTNVNVCHFYCAIDFHFNFVKWKITMAVHIIISVW